MFIGDECFGWKGHVESRAAALDAVGWWNIDVAPRLSDWMKPHARKVIRRGIDATLSSLVEDAGQTLADDLKDKLYYVERMGNLLNGFSARRLSVAEQARPFLDEDVIEFLARVPSRLRCDKMLARKLMARKFPGLHSIPYARKTSVPWEEKEFIRLVNAEPGLKAFLIDQLTAGMDSRLAEIFDVARLGEAAKRFFNGEALPPLSREWWVHLPGGWRFTRTSDDRVGTLRSLLRVLQLNLFLCSQRTGGGRGEC
jgi:hypothetical protein